MVEHTPTPKETVPLICPDPENCTELHNEEEPGTGEEHHYGCECSWCMYVYWTLKQ